MPGKLSVPGRRTNLVNSRGVLRLHKVWVGVVGLFFFFRLSFLFSFSLIGRRSDLD